MEPQDINLNDNPTIPQDTQPRFVVCTGSFPPSSLVDLRFQEITEARGDMKKRYSTVLSAYYISHLPAYVLIENGCCAQYQRNSSHLMHILFGVEHYTLITATRIIFRRFPAILKNPVSGHLQSFPRLILMLNINAERLILCLIGGVSG